MDGSCGIRHGARRFSLTAVAVVAASLFFTAPAVAQVGLGSLQIVESPTAGAALDSVTQITSPVLEVPGAEATGAVSDAVEPATASTAPVAESASAQVVTTTQPVLETAAPLVQTTAQLLETAAPLLESTQPLLETTAPLVAAAAPVTDDVAPVQQAVEALPVVPSAEQASSDGTVPTLTPILEVGEIPPAGSVGGVVVTGMSVERGTESGAAPGSHRAAERGVAPGPTSPWSPPSWIDRYASSESANEGTATAPPGRPLPGFPGTPFGLLSSVAAAIGFGGSLMVFAALVATLFLAAPGLGRRLRPIVAPWPPPIALPSLERPG